MSDYHGFIPGDAVRYRGTEYSDQWLKHSSDGTATVMEKRTGSQRWVRVSFGDGHENAYPAIDLEFAHPRLPNPEFGLDEIELAENMIDGGNG